MQEMMKRMGNMNAMPETKPILEINPNHKLIKKLSKMSKNKDELGKVEDVSILLYEQSRIVEGDRPSDPIAFSKKLINTILDSIN